MGFRQVEIANSQNQKYESLSASLINIEKSISEFSSPKHDGDHQHLSLKKKIRKNIDLINSENFSRSTTDLLLTEAILLGGTMEDLESMAEMDEEALQKQWEHLCYRIMDNPQHIGKDAGKKAKKALGEFGGKLIDKLLQIFNFLVKGN